MLNSKVNNWAVELETFNIKFENNSSVKNTLADTLSRIIKVDPNFKAEPEDDGYKSGYSCFEELPPAEVYKVSKERITKNVKIQLDTDVAIAEMKCSLPVPKDKGSTQAHIYIQAHKFSCTITHVRILPARFIQLIAQHGELYTEQQPVFNTTRYTNSFPI